MDVKGASDYYPVVEEDGKQLKRLSNTTGGPVGSGDAVANANTNRLRAWHHSSRIIRVSRASGGKDRHSKVRTSRGLRDRRVRLSVPTAIQFYDVQDRLGYDQPSKAVEWLIKAAADPIAELTSLKSPFPDTAKQLRDEKHVGEQMFDSADVESDGDPNFQQNQSQHLSMSKSSWNSDSEIRESSGLTLSRFEICDNSESSRLCLGGSSIKKCPPFPPTEVMKKANFQQNQSQHLSLSKSACSSTSETSEGSGLSLSRSESRVKARERARERAAKEKEKKNKSRIAHNVNHISHNSSSFTELLTGGINSNAAAANHSPTGSAHQNPGGDQSNLFHKPVRQWTASTPMDYFDSPLLGPSSSLQTHHSSGFPGPIHLGNSLPHAMSVFNVSGDNHPELQQHFPFNVPEHHIPVGTATLQQPGGSDYNLNFTISSGLAGYNRKTLQSNTPSLLPHHLKRYPTVDGPNLPFFMTSVAASALSPFKDMLSSPEMWHKLTANPTTQAYLENNDFVRMMHELQNNYLKDKRVIQALGVLLNINIWTPTSAEAEIPQSSSLLLLPPEYKKSLEAEPAKEMDLMELTADEVMDRESQACMEQELGNAAYTKNDFDAAIAHYTKVMELDNGNISCLMNRAVAFLAMGQYDECIKDCDKAVERGRQLKSDSKMIAISLTRKGTALVKMAKLSKDYDTAIETFQKALSEHCIPCTLKKLNDAKKAKRELELKEYFDKKLADEEHEEASGEAGVSSSGNQSQPSKPITKKNQSLLGMPDPDVEVIALSQAPPAPPQSTGVISSVSAINSPEETIENEIASEPHGMVIDIEEVNITDPSEQIFFEIDGIQAKDMELQEYSILESQGVVFGVEPLKILKSSGQMQSQIEDVAMESESSEQCGFFLMQGGLGLTKPPKDEDWKNAKEIYLMDNDLSDLPENPRCPNLSALFLPRNYKLRTIPQPFFCYMPALQILNLSKTSIKSLPDSVIKLVSLKRLFLNDCHRLMMLSPKVGDLEQLEVLDLEGAKIMDLPKEFKKLTNMTCLEVSFYGYSSNDRKAMPSNAVIPCGVICSMSQLEELNIDVNPDDKRWDARVEDIVNEVCALKRLETLKFYFPRVELLKHFKWNSLKLSHFRFTVGRHVKRIMSRVPCDAEFELERWEKCLKYINGVGVPEDIKKVLQHAVAFFLDRHATVKKLSDFGLRNMKQLKCCVMGECNEVQVIVDEADADEEDDTSKIVSDSYGTERIVLGSLEYLYIYYMKNLRSIWEGSVQKNSLFLLKSLTLRTCPQLTTIFTQGLLDNLCNLEELKVEDCPSIKSIVSCEISAEHKTSYILPNLKKISLHYMPGLVSISSGLDIAPKLEWLTFYNCPVLKNPFIDEISSKDLKKIKGERRWWEALEWSNSCPSYLEEIFVPIDIRDC